MADRSASSNIYTVMALIAFLSLACAIVYVWYRTGELFGTSNPFALLDSTKASLVLPGLLH